MSHRPLAKKARSTISFHQKSAAVTDHQANNDASESSFEVELMPAKIRRRVLHQWSVHYSLPSSCWIATIIRHLSGNNNEQHSSNRRSPYSQFEFATEAEAKKFCKAYSPPKMMTMEPNNNPPRSCFICEDPYSSKIRPFYCRNCGVAVCEKCTTRWSARMIPKTYVHSGYQPQVVRVCSSCHWLSNAHCLALLKGRYRDAIKIYETGNVNLRTCFADIRGESMFPVHCCILGGNLELLKWLVDKQLCPISVKRDAKTGKMLSVKTSSDRTLLDLAMTGKPKLDILMYLVYHKGLSITDVSDINLTAKTLEALLKSGYVPTDGPQSTIMNKVMVTNTTTTATSIVDPSEGSVGTVDNPCNLCCEKSMDCVLSPCGHMLCCTDCGKQLDTCPMCKAKCQVLPIIHC